MLRASKWTKLYQNEVILKNQLPEFSDIAWFLQTMALKYFSLLIILDVTSVFLYFNFSFSVYSGHHTILIPPVELEISPSLWLQAVSQYRGMYMYFSSW